MAKVYVSEYARMALDSRGQQAAVPEEPAVATQVLDTAGTHLSAALNAETRFVRLNADGVVSFKFAAAPTAATTDARLGANASELFGVKNNSGLKIDVIANT
jgi:hypothetical protein